MYVLRSLDMLRLAADRYNQYVILANTMNFDTSVEVDNRKTIHDTAEQRYSAVMTIAVGLLHLIRMHRLIERQSVWRRARLRLGLAKPRIPTHLEPPYKHDDEAP